MRRKPTRVVLSLGAAVCATVVATLLASAAPADANSSWDSAPCRDGCASPSPSR